tara:strand:+ start:891 stop:1217 length:327 start_codon:yes stop_codon:yes gene_type:complete
MFIVSLLVVAALYYIVAKEGGGVNPRPSPLDDAASDQDSVRASDCERHTRFPWGFECVLSLIFRKVVAFAELSSVRVDVFDNSRIFGLLVLKSNSEIWSFKQFVGKIV